MPWPYQQSTRQLSLLLPLTTARMYAHVYARLGAPAAHTPSAATRVPTQTPPGLCGLAESQWQSASTGRVGISTYNTRKLDYGR